MPSRRFRSPSSPPVRQGNTCADLLIDDLAEWFGRDGQLAAFDGIEFNVMHNQSRGDTNGDGQENDGVIDRVDAYGIGVMNGWHTFGLPWQPDEYIFYLDGKQTLRSKAGGVCQVPQYMLLSNE